MIRLLRDKINNLFRQRFERWLNKRIPIKQKQLLTSKNIFIFPTKFGFLYLFFILLLFLLATNYQNNLILFLSYVLASLFVSAMLHCFFNLCGLGIKASGEYGGYVNETINIPVTLITDKKHLSLCLFLPEQNKISIKQTDNESHCTEVLLPIMLQTRGVSDLERIVISSEYALGLFRCWSKLAFPVSLTVYPHPITFKKNSLIEPIHTTNDVSNENSYHSNMETGIDEYIDLARYRQGESLAKVSWKHVAKGQGWLSRQYGEALGETVYLSLHQMPSKNIEKQLSMLCFAILDCAQQGDEYGVLLGDKRISPNSGQHHLLMCLTALATFNTKGAI